jgi:hypothetical protein
MCFQDENMSCGFELGVFLIFTSSSFPKTAVYNNINVLHLTITSISIDT